jgi:hypothetical protein
VQGGLSANSALSESDPSGAVALARAELAAEFLADLRRLDDQLRETKRKLAAAVRASRTTLTRRLRRRTRRCRDHYR